MVCYVVVRTLHEPVYEYTFLLLMHNHLMVIFSGLYCNSAQNVNRRSLAVASASH